MTMIQSFSSILIHDINVLHFFIFIYIYFYIGWLPKWTQLFKPSFDSNLELKLKLGPISRNKWNWIETTFGYGIGNNYN